MTDVSSRLHISPFQLGSPFRILYVTFFFLEGIVYVVGYELCSEIYLDSNPLSVTCWSYDIKIISPLSSFPCLKNGLIFLILWGSGKA